MAFDQLMTVQWITARDLQLKPQLRNSQRERFHRFGQPSTRSLSHSTTYIASHGVTCRISKGFWAAKASVLAFAVEPAVKAPAALLAVAQVLQNQLSAVSPVTSRLQRAVGFSVPPARLDHLLQLQTDCFARAAAMSKRSLPHS